MLNVTQDSEWHSEGITEETVIGHSSQCLCHILDSEG